MEVVLTDSQYTLDASAQTITLSKPYDVLNIGQIKTIWNITKHNLLYDSGNPQRAGITLSGAVITYDYDNSNHADTDKLRITIDTELQFVDLKTVLLENQSIGAGELVASTQFDILGVKDVSLFVRSTKNFTFYIQVSDDQSAGCAWHDLCDESANPITIQCEGKGSPIVEAGKSIRKSIKAMQMRVLAQNNDTSSDTPYIGVM